MVWKKNKKNKVADEGSVPPPDVDNNNETLDKGDQPPTDQPLMTKSKKKRKLGRRLRGRYKKKHPFELQTEPIWDDEAMTMNDEQLLKNADNIDVNTMEGRPKYYRIQRVRQPSEPLLYHHGRDEKDEFSKDLLDTLRPTLYMMILFGRFPFTFIKKPDHTYKCKLLFYHPKFVYFCISFVIIIYVFIVTLVHFYRITFLKRYEDMTDIEDKRARFYEYIFTERYLVCMWFIYAAFIHLIIETSLIFVRIKMIEDYFGMLTRAVALMRMNVGDGINRFVLKAIIFFAIFTLIFVVLFFFKIGPTSCGFPTMMAILLFAEYDEDMFIPVEENPFKFGAKLTWFRALGGIFLFLLWILPKFWVFLYIIHCKLLINVYGTYNARVYLCILKGGSYMDTRQGFLIFRSLYLDHLVILDMVEGCDRIFSYIIEFYFTFTIINLIFTGFLLFRGVFESEYPVLKQEENYIPRTHDYIPNIFLFLFDLIILLCLTIYPTQVLNESSAGMDIVRRAGVFNRKKSYTLIFQLSLFCNIVRGRVLGMLAGDLLDFGIFEFGSLFVNFWNFIMTIYEFWPRFAAKIPEEFTGEDMKKVVKALEPAINRTLSGTIAEGFKF